MQQWGLFRTLHHRLFSDGPLFNSNWRHNFFLLFTSVDMLQNVINIRIYCCLLLHFLEDFIICTYTPIIAMLQVSVITLTFRLVKIFSNCWLTNNISYSPGKTYPLCFSQKYMFKTQLCCVLHEGVLNIHISNTWGWVKRKPQILNIFYLQNIMDDMVCWSMTHIQMWGYFNHCHTAIFLHDGLNCCNGLCCHYSVCMTRSRRVCYRTNAVHELPSPLIHLL